MTDSEPQKLVNVQAQVGLEEVAAIKVAEVERQCLIDEAQFKFDLKEASAKAHELKTGLMKIAEEEFRKEHPEIGKIEELLKKVFKEKVSVQFQAVNEAHAGKPMTLTVSVSAQGSVPFSGPKTKDRIKEIDAKEKDVTDLEEKLVETKKKQSQLPYLERAAKAAVAKARLSQTKEGQAVLAHMDNVTLPGLPAPKSK